MRSLFRFLTSTFVITFLFASVGYSQAIQTGGITGVVTDQTGSLVNGATVDVVALSTGRSVRNVTTEDDGRYTANLLPPGLYRVQITAPNFKKAIIDGVQVTITETTRVDIKLEAGRIEETVNVSATPTLVNRKTPPPDRPSTLRLWRRCLWPHLTFYSCSIYRPALPANPLMFVRRVEGKQTLVSMDNAPAITAFR